VDKNQCCFPDTKVSHRYTTKDSVNTTSMGIGQNFRALVYRTPWLQIRRRHEDRQRPVVFRKFPLLLVRDKTTNSPQISRFTRIPADRQFYSMESDDDNEPTRVLRSKRTLCSRRIWKGWRPKVKRASMPTTKQPTVEERTRAACAPYDVTNMGIQPNHHALRRLIRGCNTADQDSEQVQFVDYVRKLQRGRVADPVAFLDPLSAGDVQCNAMDWSADTNATLTVDSIPACFKALERNLSRTAQPYMPIVARINRMRVEFM
jgi:hypothetical protein